MIRQPKSRQSRIRLRLLSEIIKNKRKIWFWFLMIVFLIFACRAAYVAGNRTGRMRQMETEQQQQQQQRETSAVVKTVMPAAPRKMAVADSEENWETF